MRSLQAMDVEDETGQDTGPSSSVPKATMLWGGTLDPTDFEDEDAQVAEPGYNTGSSNEPSETTSDSPRKICKRKAPGEDTLSQIGQVCAPFTKNKE